MAARAVGTVEKFIPKRGFGIIQPSEGGDSVFVHWSQISSEDSWPQLQPGTEVEYDPATDDKGKPVAHNVTLPGGGPVVGAEDPSKANRTLSKSAVSGEVVFFKKESGYGFIRADEAITFPRKEPAGTQIYVDREELVNAEGSACNLAKGMKVQFKVYQPEGKEGLAAAEVTGADGEPLIYEPPPKGKGKGKGKAKGYDFKGKGYYDKGYSSKGYGGYGDGYGGKGYGYGGYGGKGGYSKGDSWRGGSWGGDSWKGGSSYPGVQRSIQKPAFASQGYSSPKGGSSGKGFSSLGRSGPPIGSPVAKGSGVTPPWRGGDKGSGGKGYKGKSKGY